MSWREQVNKYMTRHCNHFVELCKYIYIYFNHNNFSAPGYVEFFNVSQIDDLGGPRRVRIIWRPPTEREQNGIIRYYNISWTPEGV